MGYRLNQKLEPIEKGKSLSQKLTLEPNGEIEGRRKVRLRPVSLANIPWGTSAPTDLYLHRGKELSLLFRQGQRLPFDSFAEFSRSTDRLYYDKEMSVDWETLVDFNLTFIIDSPLSIEGKAAVAYNSAIRQTERIFDDFNEETYQTANNLVECLNKMMQDPDAGGCLFQLTIHDYYTYTHSIHVYIYSTMLTQVFMENLSQQCLHDVGVAFLLHDIGKKDINPDILNKPGKLDDEEWIIIKKHPIVGYELLKEVGPPLSDEFTHIVLQHHEKCDGTGYPYQLKEEEIGQFGKICAIADVYDALTTRRSYKEALSKTAALTIMRDSSGHFDDQMLTKFIQMAAPFLD
jgi:HD-GYP domain-containing protein (c-di-GMP phosphodiesterase class II)